MGEKIKNKNPWAAFQLYQAHVRTPKLGFEPSTSGLGDWIQEHNDVNNF